MLSLKVAKLLKEAGYPQPWTDVMPYPELHREVILLKLDVVMPLEIAEKMGYYNGMSSPQMINFKEELFLMPTLPELIKACGVRFESLKRISFLAWNAVGFNEKTLPDGKDDSAYIITKGGSPEDAVAYLYLELNPKQNA